MRKRDIELATQFLQLSGQSWFGENYILKLSGHNLINDFNKHVNCLVRLFFILNINFSHCGSCSVAQLCSPLCHPKGCSTQAFSVLQYTSEFAQTHVHVSWWYHSTFSSSVDPSPVFNFPGIRVFSNECKAHQFKTLEYSLNSYY